MSSVIVAEVRTEILKRANPEYAERTRRYFRETVKTHGLKTSQEREVVKLIYPKVKGNLSLALEVAEELVKSRILEEASVGIKIMRRMTRLFTPELFDVFDSWVDHLTNWANTDGLSTWLISETIRLDPGLWKRLLQWTASDNRWRRRAAAVSLVPIARKGEMLDEAFTIADRLMTDGDDMVQRGVGWLLKEASRIHQDDVRDHLLRWKNETSALVLRYASEKLPEGKRVLKTR